MTDDAHDRLDAPARANIKREIQSLAGGGTKLPILGLAFVVAGLGCSHESLAAPPLRNSIAAPLAVARPEQIGVATMDPDGTILLHLRAERPGAMGDGLLRYRPGQAGYDAVRAHLPALRPGATVPVPPFR